MQRPDLVRGAVLSAGGVWSDALRPLALWGGAREGGGGCGVCVFVYKCKHKLLANDDNSNSDTLFFFKKLSFTENDGDIDSNLKNNSFGCVSDKIFCTKEFDTNPRGVIFFFFCFLLFSLIVCCISNTANDGNWLLIVLVANLYFFCF